MFSFSRLSSLPLTRHVVRARTRSAATSARNQDRFKTALFFHADVQKELKAITGLNYDRVFRLQKRGEDIESPSYQFVTDEELEAMMKETRQKAERKLQMPPVMDERVDEDKVLERDSAIVGYDAAPIVFTDITYGVHDRERIIVVREPDGMLRDARWEERDRMNQVYFPKAERKLDIPAIFETEKLKVVLGPDKYEYILNRNCVQFEPDHPTYIRTSEAVFDDIAAHGHYDILHSTRHYGPMTFYLVYNKKCDDLVVHYFKNKNLVDAAIVVRLFGLLHADSAVSRPAADLATLDLLRLFIDSDSLKSSKLHVALEAMLEAIKADKKTLKGVKEAQGASEDK